MFTQCRGCGEIFKVGVDDLVTAASMVRCSSCGAVFNSLDTLSEYKPQEGTDLILHENDNPPPLLTHEFKPSVLKVALPETNKTSVLSSNSDEAAGFAENSEGFDEDLVFNVKPDFVAEQESEAPKKSSLPWVFATLLLLGLGFWQASLALKNGTLTLPEGALKQKVCTFIECFSGIEQSNLNKIALVSRSIRQHPGRDNALIITTGIINSDEKAQAFPALQVKMSNLNGEIVAMRRFLPSEYINQEAISAGMLPNTLIPITLELQSPGKNAVTFEVGFSSTYGAN
jgi:predicted Zn finger-like uncharacterized protein